MIDDVIKTTYLRHKAFQLAPSPDLGTSLTHPEFPGFRKFKRCANDICIC